MATLIIYSKVGSEKKKSLKLNLWEYKLILDILIMLWKVKTETKTAARRYLSFKILPATTKCLPTPALYVEEKKKVLGANIHEILWIKMSGDNNFLII